MKEYQRKGMLADAYLNNRSLADMDFVQEFQEETKPSRVLRTQHRKEEQRHIRNKKYYLDD